MIIYLISNNLVIDDINYESDMPVDEKRINRPLSIEGEKLASKLSEKIVVSEIYSSAFASSIATAKYIACKNNLIININSALNDIKIGEMARHNIKMLRFMQDRNFDYKYVNGESLNDGKRRILPLFKKIISRNADTAIITHKRIIMSLLLNYLDTGYNLDERLILSFKDKVVLDDNENDCDILKLTINDEKIENIEVLEIEG